METEEVRRKKVDDILGSVKNAKRIYRDQGADAILREPELLPFLIESLYSDDKLKSIRSAWLLELVCLYEIRLLLPYLAEFTTDLNKLNHESAIRPVSKICSLISQYHADHPGKVPGQNDQCQQDMIEASFIWLTGNHKIAAQVFAMESLYLLGQDSDWIHDELFSILDKDYPNRSIGYQCRARKIMDKISKVKRKKY
jgi:hypothetical protein